MGSRQLSDWGRDPEASWVVCSPRNWGIFNVVHVVFSRISNPLGKQQKVKSLSVIQISHSEWVASFCAHDILLCHSLCIQLLADPLRYTVGQLCIGKLCHVSGTDLWNKTVAAEHLTRTVLVILPICVRECSFHFSFISKFEPFQNANIMAMGINRWFTAKHAPDLKKMPLEASSCFRIQNSISS